MKIIKIPKWFQLLFPSIIWRFKEKEKIIYLTFDDGPTKELTFWILKELEKYNAKATFFCLGKNIEKHKENFHLISKKEHQIGNHTFNHLNGWNTKNTNYFEDIEKCQKIYQSKLFRPPFGRINLSQINKLKKEYKIIMWDINCWDFDSDKKSNSSKILKNIESGSIVLLHDNLKSEKKLRVILPKILSHFTKKGYSFKAID
jgi:peptidoglycan/xylan/chitin deacetylase (PgdA/CDA1 family)